MAKFWFFIITGAGRTPMFPSLGCIQYGYNATTFSDNKI